MNSHLHGKLYSLIKNIFYIYVAVGETHVAGNKDIWLVKSSCNRMA